MKLIALVVSFLIAHNIFAQKDTVNEWTFSGYGELYYSYDFSNPENHEKPDFVYNHKRHNEINANLLLIKANYLNERYRANVGLMAGNYAQYNLSSEPYWAQFVYEANIGIQLSKNNLWLDAGILPSHIGFESAISADCWTLTRSILAENSPYYESGVKVSYVSNDEKLLLSGMVLNGWQRIRKPDYIQKPSFGFQATFKPTSKLTFNYSNFIGTDKPDSLKSLRHYHNVYAQYNVTNGFGIIAGYDIGYEKVLDGNFSNWYSAVVIVRQRLGERSIVAFRSEYFSDKDEVIIVTDMSGGFQTLGLSSNFDYKVNDKVVCRVEGKLYSSQSKIFEEYTSSRNYSITTNLTIKL